MSEPDEPQSLSSCFAAAQTQRNKLDHIANGNGAEFQENVSSAIEKYRESARIAAQVSLFSSNESIEDVSSRDLQYFAIHYHIAELLFRSNRDNRKATLLKARVELEHFLKLVDSYDMLSAEDSKLYERYLDDKDSFSTTPNADAAARRQTKIVRFREEKALKQRFEYIKRDPLALQNGDQTLRDLYLTQVAIFVHQAFQSLESIAQELHILSLAPPEQPTNEDPSPDSRARSTENTRDPYSDRLDPSVASLLANAKGGPILSKDGRPIRPFTLLDSRQRLRDGVFRPDHSLPTMTIDEYLEEEKRRGGIIEGGGEASGRKEAINEDDYEAADKETMKQRYWDEFKEENPRGSGNTMNMG